MSKLRWVSLIFAREELHGYQCEDVAADIHSAESPCRLSKCLRRVKVAKRVALGYVLALGRVHAL